MAKNDDTLAPIEDEHIIRSGNLAVGNGHAIYWVDWGNKRIQNPIFYLHGGPGGGFDANDFLRFDPKQHRVVFHDQRGSGRSTPFASITHNTTQDLLSDITKLKEHLGFNKISLYGISWGSTLSLLYAIEHPKSVETMLIGGIFLARKADEAFYLHGKIATHFPEAWERFIATAPKDKQGAIAKYYKEKLFSGKVSERKQFAKEWMLYESALLRLDYQPQKLEQQLKDFAAESLAYLEAHYLLNDCFIAENFILDNARKLRDLPIVIVQGRYDFICMPAAAYELKQALGDNAILHFVASGHASSDMVQREIIRAYTNMLWR